MTLSRIFSSRDVFYSPVIYPCTAHCSYFQLFTPTSGTQTIQNFIDTHERRTNTVVYRLLICLFIDGRNSLFLVMILGFSG